MSYKLHPKNHTPHTTQQIYLSTKITSPNISLYTLTQSIFSQVQTKISPVTNLMFSGSQTWSRTVSSQSGISWVLYNLYPGLSQDDSVGPSPQESIQSIPTLATQSGARSHDPGLRFIQDWGGPHIGFLVP